MQLNDWGRVVAECWAGIPVHFVHVALDEWVVMPNHLHGVLVIADSTSVVGAQVGAQVGVQQCFAPADVDCAHPNVSPGSLGAIILSFKSAVTKHINLVRGVTAPPVWQRNYYEHIARDERGLNAIRQYVRRNPAQWNMDRDNATNGQPVAATANEFAREAQA